MDYANIGAPPGNLSADMQVHREEGSVLVRAKCDIKRSVMSMERECAYKREEVR